MAEPDQITSSTKVIEPGRSGSAEMSMAASRGPGTPFGRSLQTPVGIEPMVDEEELKVAPAGTTTNKGHGGEESRKDTCGGKKMKKVNFHVDV